MQLNKDYKVAQDKPFPLFWMIHDLAGLSTATGQYAGHTSGGVSEDHLVMDVGEGAGSSSSPVHEVEKDVVPAQRAGKKVSYGDNASTGSKRKQVQNPSPIVSKKKTVEQVLEALDRLVELSNRRIRILEQCMDEDDKFSFEICIDKLISLPDLSDEEAYVAAEALKSLENRIFFMTMRPSAIDYWLSLRVKEFRHRQD